MTPPGNCIAESQGTRDAIRAVLKPNSIAIAGASSDASKLASLPLAFLQRQGYAGRIYPINPAVEEISGARCYGSIADIPEDIDLLVITVAASKIPQLLGQCRPGQVRSALILSSGYAESGVEGARMQNELRELALSKGIRFVGPNSVGIANLWQKVVPSISQVFDQSGLTPGPVGFVSQSGAVGTAITALAHAERLGIGYFVSTGNEGDLEFGDFCEYFLHDPSVKVIAGYLESVRDGKKFQRVAHEASVAGKPIVLMKVGSTQIGSRAVRSHTGSLAGSEEVYRSVFKYGNVVRAQSIEELLDALKVFCAYPAPVARDTKGRVAILTHSGGAGVLMADTAVQLGLDVAPVSEALLAALKQRLPSYASFQNPVDMTANVIFDPKSMADIVRVTAESGHYDAVMLCVNLIWRQGERLAEELLKVKSEMKPILSLAWIAGRNEPLERLNRNAVPVYTDPVRCTRAVAAKLNWDIGRSRIHALAALKAGEQAGFSVEALRHFAGRQQLLQQYDIPIEAGYLAENRVQALEYANRLGYPVAAKLIAEDLIHKSDVGGVIVAIRDDEALEMALTKLEAVNVERRQGFLIQKMAGAGIELFAGIKRDEVFGPITVFGLGGIYVEILREVVLRPSPFGVEEATEMIRAAKFFPLLDGARGWPRCDVRSLAVLLSQLSILSVNEPAVCAVDLNPIIVNADGALVVDFRFELDGSRPKPAGTASQD